MDEAVVENAGIFVPSGCGFPWPRQAILSRTLLNFNWLPANGERFLDHCASQALRAFFRDLLFHHVSVGEWSA